MLFDCSDLVLKHFDKPKQVGKLDPAKSSVVYLRIGKQSIGEVLDLYLDINAQQKIVAAKFQAYGNPFLIAGASWLLEKIRYLTLSEAEQLSYKDMMTVLQFPTTKQATAVILEQALKQATFLWRKQHDH